METSKKQPKNVKFTESKPQEIKESQEVKVGK
jgi:hypothetical protein